MPLHWIRPPQLPTAAAHDQDEAGPERLSWISYIISFYVIAQFWLLHRLVFRVTNLATYRMLSFSRRHGLLSPQGAAVLERHTSLQGIFSLFIYALAIPVALINPDAGKLCWLGLALTPRIASLVAKRPGAAGTPVSPPA